jgi:hypothetical protein
LTALSWNCGLAELIISAMRSTTVCLFSATISRARVVTSLNRKIESKISYARSYYFF